MLSIFTVVAPFYQNQIKDFYKTNHSYLVSRSIIAKDASYEFDVDQLTNEKLLSEFVLWNTNKTKYTLTSQEVFDLERFVFENRSKVMAIFPSDKFMFECVESVIGTDYARARLSDDALFPYYMLTIGQSTWTYLREIIDMMRK